MMTQEAAILLLLAEGRQALSEYQDEVRRLRAENDGLREQLVTVDDRGTG